MSPEILHVRRQGSGPVLVLLHGVAGSGAIWEPVSSQLESSFDVVRIDLLGYGLSPKPSGEYTVQRQLQAIHDTLKEHDILEPFHLAGLSMGSLLALNYTAAYPEQVTKLACIGLTDYHTEAEGREHIRHDVSARFALEHPFLGRTVIAGVWKLGYYFPILGRHLASPYYSAPMVHESFMNPFRVFRSCLQHCMLENLAPALLNATDNFERLFIHGADDRWSDLATVKKDINEHAGTILHVLPGVAHNTVVIAPIVTAQLLQNFFQAL